ncbi:lytic transglycosylase domain-containing protein [Magnetovibrio sp. PR-2]|uniref:lytic transglycosylase domain-containing protein n=1 Tax=Magnetovibrio sp. PR-2 TaxID=3120356 RepID=UPI002FCDF308
MIRVYPRFIILGLLTLAVWIVGIAPAFALTRVEVKRLVVETALDKNVPPSLALAVAKVESDFNAHALSPAGARGVMQIMPKTAQDEFGVAEDDLWDAQTNVRLGVRFLKELHHMYGERWELALSHYNGGSLNRSGADAHPHAYTRRYVKSVMKWQQVYTEQNAVWQVLSDQTENVRVAKAAPKSDVPKDVPEDVQELDIVEWESHAEDVAYEHDEWEVIDLEPRPRHRDVAFDRRPPPRHHAKRRGPVRVFRGSHFPKHWH